MLQDSEAAAKFIDTIIDAKLQGTELEADVRQTLHQNLLEQLELQITTAIVSLLNRQEQIEVEHLIDSGREAEVEEYLEKHDVDLNRLLANVMADFQAVYLGA